MDKTEINSLEGTKQQKTQKRNEKVRTLTKKLHDVSAHRGRTIVLFDPQPLLLLLPNIICSNTSSIEMMGKMTPWLVDTILFNVIKNYERNRAARVSRTS